MIQREQVLFNRVLHFALPCFYRSTEQPNKTHLREGFSRFAIFKTTIGSATQLDGMVNGRIYLVGVYLQPHHHNRHTKLYICVSIISGYIFKSNMAFLQSGPWLRAHEAVWLLLKKKKKKKEERKKKKLKYFCT